jgi:hypothetical protein
MSEAIPVQSLGWFTTKYVVFAIIAAMMAYVIRRSGYFYSHTAWLGAARSFSRRCSFPSA